MAWSARVFLSVLSEESSRLFVDGSTGSDCHELDGRRSGPVDDAKPPDPHTPQAEEVPFERLPVMRIDEHRPQNGPHFLLELRVEVSEQGTDSFRSPECARRYGHLRRGSWLAPDQLLEGVQPL